MAGMSEKSQARGRAAYTELVCLVMGAYIMMLSMADASKVYTVGGAETGWTLDVNYTQWAATYTYYTGDSLFFPYSASAHSVLQVSGADYKTCNTSANALFSDNGQGNTTVPLPTAGKYWFICGVGNHCSQRQMKFSIDVLATPTAPTPAAPTPTPADSAAVPSSIPAFLILLAPLTLLTFFV